MTTSRETWRVLTLESIGTVTERSVMSEASRRTSLKVIRTRFTLKTVSGAGNPFPLKPTTTSASPIGYISTSARTGSPSSTSPSFRFPAAKAVQQKAAIEKDKNATHRLLEIRILEIFRLIVFSLLIKSQGRYPSSCPPIGRQPCRRQF